MRTEEILRRRQAILQHFHIPAKTGSSKDQLEVDPVLRRKLKIYGKESSHTFVDQLFGGYLLSTVICESCHQPYQILEPFMDLSLPVSEEKSPPSGSYKRGGPKTSGSCFSPPPATPIIQSKHQRKKERARKVKGNSIFIWFPQFRDSAKETYEISTLHFPNIDELHFLAAGKYNKSVKRTGSESPEDPTSAIEDSEVKVDGFVTTADGEATKGQAEDKAGNSVTAESSVDDEDASVLVAGSHPTADEEEVDDDEDLSESADVEDNEETNDRDIEEMARKMRELSVQAEDMLLQNSDGGDKLDAATLRKIRSDWISRSLCSLAVRYQAANHECSVMSCLNLFTAPELLTGSNKYGCDNCTRRKAAAATETGNLFNFQLV